MIIGITGTIGAGKGTVVEYLVQKKGFVHFSARALILEEVKKRGLEVIRENTTLVANDLRAAFGPDYIAKELCRRAAEVQKQGKNAVVESLRSIGEIEFIRAIPGSKVFAVDADPKIRYERVQSRKSELDQITFERFAAQEKAEINPDDPTKGNLSACIAMADVVFMNNGNFEELSKQVEKALAR
ncbi:MAG: AAA family ATPase [Patescibacteria group bacterium]